MKEYEVLIREIYERTVYVMADSEKEAIDKVADEYAEMEDYEVNQDDFVNAEFEIVENK